MGWLYYVLFPYFIPLVLVLYPAFKIVMKIRQCHGAATERERCQYQIVLSVIGGYFFFHMFYYLLWMGRETEALILEKSAFRQLLGLHVWYIARPLFALINLGWHITTPLSPFVFDADLLEELPGPWVNKNRTANASSAEDCIVLQDRNVSSTDSVDAGASSVQVKVTKDSEWTEIHNPLQPMDTLDSEREYHQIPL